MLCDEELEEKMRRVVFVAVVILLVLVVAEENILVVILLMDTGRTYCHCIHSTLALIIKHSRSRMFFVSLFAMVDLGSFSGSFVGF